MVMRRLILTVVATALVASGCAFFQTQEEKTAQDLASDGMEQYENGRYRDAIKSFENLKDWYPFSNLASLAELKTADSYYQLEEYEDAVFAYEEFINLHPRNEAVPYVIYQIGRCYYEQIETIDRDQTASRKALDTFGRLKQQYPDSPYALKAEEHIRECLKHLAGYEFNVGLFYYKTKHYRAALHRFMAVLSKYPDVGIQHKALEYISLCEESLKSETVED